MNIRMIYHDMILEIIFLGSSNWVSNKVKPDVKTSNNRIPHVNTIVSKEDAYSVDKEFPAHDGNKQKTNFMRRKCIYGYDMRIMNKSAGTVSPRSQSET